LTFIGILCLATKKRLNLALIDVEMTRRGLTQTDLSAHLGLTKQAVCKVFRGSGEKLFKPQNTLARAEILDLPIEDLLISVDSPYIWAQKK
jgi:hypothetical protein